MTIRAHDVDEGSSRGFLVSSRVEDLLQGNPSLLPSWANDVTFSSWRRITSGPNAGGIHLTVGALGREAQSFQLDVNGVVGYADLSSAEVSVLNQWVIFEVDIDEADINEPQGTGVWVTNEVHIEYATDRTGLTSEDHEIDYRIL